MGPRAFYSSESSRKLDICKRGRFLQKGVDFLVMKMFILSLFMFTKDASSVHEVLLSMKVFCFPRKHLQGILQDYQ